MEGKTIYAIPVRKRVFIAESSPNQRALVLASKNGPGYFILYRNEEINIKRVSAKDIDEIEDWIVLIAGGFKDAMKSARESYGIHIENGAMRIDLDNGRKVKLFTCPNITEEETCLKNGERCLFFAHKGAVFESCLKE